MPRWTLEENLVHNRCVRRTDTGVQIDAVPQMVPVRLNPFKIWTNQNFHFCEKNRARSIFDMWNQS